MLAQLFINISARLPDPAKRPGERDLRPRPIGWAEEGCPARVGSVPTEVIT